LPKSDDEILTALNALAKLANFSPEKSPIQHAEAEKVKRTVDEENLDLDRQHQEKVRKAELDEKRQKIEHRNAIVDQVFKLCKYWSYASLTLVTLDALTAPGWFPSCLPRFNLEREVSVVLLGTTVVSAIGLAVALTRGVFNSDRDK
jgi:hypothetical protein